MSMFPKQGKRRNVQQISQLVGRRRTVPSDTSPSDGQQARHRLLLVEDHDCLAEATAEFIRGEGLEVQVVGCGRDALEVAPTFQPEIVVCDMGLPDMNGLEVAWALRSNLRAKSPVIAIWSAMTDGDLVAFERSGHSKVVDLFLSKPLTPEKLERLLSALNPLRRAASKTKR